MKRVGLAVLLVLGMLALAEGRLKAGWIYVGPIGDYGWTHAHDVGRREAAKAFPWLQTLYVESVPEGQVGSYIDQMVRQGVKVIFATSFGYMDGVLEAAKRYPNVIFAHASGFKRAPNVATYMADFYQVYYLNGLMAGALTKTGKVGYVGAFPIPEVKRHINAFALGVRAVNPKAKVLVRWIYEWYSPAAAKEATEALIAEGADVFAFTEDSPTVVQVAAGHKLPSFAHYSPMLKFAPDYVVSGQLVDWGVIYKDFLAKVYAGLYTPKNLEDVDYWWLLPQKAVALGADRGVPVNPKFIPALKAKKIHHPVFGEISVYDLVMKLKAMMSDVELAFDPFQGPIKDRKGNLRVPAGVRPTQAELESLEWAVQGVEGPWPNEPK